MATPPQQKAHWKDTAIAQSEAITDAWEVTKTYAGRLAEWILFGCMVVNIVEILPGVTVFPFVSNVVLGIQAVTLDIAGFGLASMADHARSHGDEKAAHKATITGFFLIGIMIVTLLLVTVGLLWPFLKIYTDPAEKGLILIRVVMTVIYGHVIHSLRRATTKMDPTQNQMEALTHQLTQQVEDLTTTFNLQVQHLTAELSQIETNVQNRLTESSTVLANELAPLQENVQKHQEELALVPTLQAMVQRIESSTTEDIRRVKAALDSRAQTPVIEPHMHNERPVLHALPSREKSRFDARAFVFACLQKDADCKLADIAKLAALQGQELSQSSISRYRTQFFARSESSTVGNDESSTMKAESPSIDESVVAS